MINAQSVRVAGDWQTSGLTLASQFGSTQAVGKVSEFVLIARQFHPDCHFRQLPEAGRASRRLTERGERDKPKICQRSCDLE